jgi:hypothetical protein
VRRALARFWETDRSLPILLVLLVVVELVLPAVLLDERFGGSWIDLLFTAVLVAGVASVWKEGRWVVRGVYLLGALSLAVRWTARAGLVEGLEGWRALTSLVALALLTFVVLVKVLRPGLVTHHRIEGAIAAYLLLGISWASAYEWLAWRDPAAFAGAVTTGLASSRWVYYSLVTLTTMGYGDITPVAPAARSLAVAEALTGQLYLAILISRLVALELQQRSEAPSG